MEVTSVMLTSKAMELANQVRADVRSVHKREYRGVEAIEVSPSLWATLLRELHYNVIIDPVNCTMFGEAVEVNGWLPWMCWYVRGVPRVKLGRLA